MRRDSFEFIFLQRRLTRGPFSFRCSCEAFPLTKSSPKSGVTLLELMVALGLLAMLLLVAWSLFDNLQKAEDRSDGLANRVQILRQIRTWLADDLDHLVVNVNDGSPSGSEDHFVGDSTGFVATVSPSLDPLPFLQDAFASTTPQGDTIARQEPEEERELSSVYDTDQDLQVRAARKSPWTLEKIRIDYSLEPQLNGEPNSAPAPTDDIVYKLVRRERLHTAVSSSSLSREPRNAAAAIMDSPESIPAADRQLSIRDLYRQSDETLDTPGPALKEKTIEGIQKAQFRYFDGSVWNTDWDSRKRKTIPLAIAVQFDFPSRSKARNDRDKRKDQASNSDLAEVSSDQSFGTIDTLLAQQPTAQSEPMNNEEYLITTSSTEVTIIVATHFRKSNATAEESKSPNDRNSPFPSGSTTRRSP